MFWTGGWRRAGVKVGGGVYVCVGSALGGAGALQWGVALSRLVAMEPGLWILISTSWLKPVSQGGRAE